MPAANIRVVPNPPGVAQIDAEMQRFLLEKARRVQRNARRLAPGRMGRKVNAVVVGKSVRIESTHPATMFVIGGTKPHLIRPRYRKILKFTTQRGTVFARVVHHPGTKKNDFLTKALRMG